MARRILAGLLVLLACVAGSATVRAHDLPNQIVVQAFARFADGRLALVVRVPLILLQGRGLARDAQGFLDLDAVDADLERATLALAEDLRLLADGVPLAPERYAFRLSPPAAAGFETFEEARAHVFGPPLPPDLQVPWNQGFLDIWYRFPPAGPDGLVLDVQIGEGYGELLQVVLRYETPGGEVRAFRVHGDHGRLELDPGLWTAAGSFVRAGTLHILSGLDHVLFLFCLILPFRLGDFRALLLIVTAFTGAHTLTLTGAAFGLVPGGDWFPPLIEVLIAASIIWLALENIWSVWRGRERAALRHRWLVSGGFGLIHGFGFAFVLSGELQFAGDHLLAALLAFNVGVELGQIAILLAALPVLDLVLRAPRLRPFAVTVTSAVLAHIAWHWLQERLLDLSYASAPEVDWGLIRLIAAGLLIAVGAVLLLPRLRRHPASGDG